jgi:hypothetical protein
MAIFPTVAEIAETLNNNVSNNHMQEIDVFLKTFNFTNEAIREWFICYGGIEAIRKWRQFNKHEDIEKSNWPYAYHFKQECIYNLDNYEQQIAHEADYYLTENTKIQEADVVSIECPPSPIDRIADAIEQINVKMPQEKLPYITYLVKNGLLFHDGKRVIKSLNDVASALKDYLNKDHTYANLPMGQKEIKLTWQFLQETFLQPNYEKYSEKACRDAIRMANYN